MQVKHTSEIADKLTELAAAIRAMDESIPGRYAYLTVDVTIHRHEGDGTTNGEAMAFIDRYAAAIGIPAESISASGNSYGAHQTTGLTACVFPQMPQPKIPKFDPNI